MIRNINGRKITVYLNKRNIICLFILILASLLMLCYGCSANKHFVFYFLRKRSYNYTSNYLFSTITEITQIGFVCNFLHKCWRIKLKTRFFGSTYSYIKTTKLRGCKNAKLQIDSLSVSYCFPHRNGEAS